MAFSVYYIYQNSGGYVKRIRDEDFEAEEQIDQLSHGHGETSYNMKVCVCLQYCIFFIVLFSK